MAILGTFNNRLVPAILEDSPEIVIPSEYNFLRLSLSRENWPAAGGTISLGVSTNTGQSWRWFSYFIAAFVPDAKHPDVASYPAVIEYGWNPNIGGLKANRMKFRTEFAESFRSNVTVEAGTIVAG
jgi:hypothetical protein